MNRKRWLQLTQAAICILCGIVVWNYGSGSEGTEFIGGRVTGPLLDMKDIGTLLFIPALLLTFFYQRLAAAVLFVSSLFCLPLYLYFTAPGPFRWIFRGRYSVPLQANFVWEKSAMTGIVVLAVAACFGLRISLVQAKNSTNQG